MTESGATRVAVYLDFDNIVISRYDQVNGRNSFQRDKTKGLEAARLAKARVDVGAILDFASSFGTVVLTRAYADWSADVNAEYREQPSQTLIKSAGNKYLKEEFPRLDSIKKARIFKPKKDGKKESKAAE